MRRSVKTAAVAIVMGMALAAPVYAMTGGELKAAHTSEYTSGTESVYGPALTQAQLDTVAQTVSDFVNNYIKDGMTEEQKIRAIHTYLFQNVSYAENCSENSANTAYGALVNHTAQCSGYARAFKAMCDAVGIECYYVHANADAMNPSHQWNIVRYNGQYYHMDVQVNCMGAGADAIYLSATHPCTYDQSAYPQVSGTDAQVTRFAEGQGDYAAAAQNITVAAFPSEDAFILNIESEKTEEMSTVDYGVCQAIKLPDDVGSIKLDASSPYNEADYEMQVAIIALKGNESRQQGGLYLAQEGPQTNFQTLKKGQSVSLDPLGQGRSAAEIAKYCRENDIFFKFIIFDGRAYRKQEQEKGSVVIQDFGNAIPAMTQYFTY